MEYKKSYCEGFCQHPCCWSSLSNHLDSFEIDLKVNENFEENKMLESTKLSNKYKNSDLKNYSMKNLSEDFDFNSQINTNKLRNMNDSFLRNKKEKKHINNTAQIRNSTDIYLNNKFDPYEPQKCMIWIPNPTNNFNNISQEQINNNMSPKNYNLLNDQFNNEFLKNNQHYKNSNSNLMKKKSKIIQKANLSRNQIIDRKIDNKRFLSDETMAEILGIPIDTMRYILIYSTEEYLNTYNTVEELSKEHNKFNNQTVEEKTIKKDNCTSKLPKLKDNSPSSKANSSHLQDKLTLVKIDLPELPSGVKSTKPFTYSRNNTWNFALEPVPDSYQEEGFRIPSSRRSKRATVSPDTLPPFSSTNTTPYGMDYENYLRQSPINHISPANEVKSKKINNQYQTIENTPGKTSKILEFGSPLQDRSSKKDVRKVNDISEKSQYLSKANSNLNDFTNQNFNIEENIPPPPSPTEISYKHHNETIINKTNSENIKMTVEALKEIGECYFYDDLNDSSKSNEDFNLISLSKIESQIQEHSNEDLIKSNEDSEHIAIRVDLLSPIIEEKTDKNNASKTF